MSFQTSLDLRNPDLAVEHSSYVNGVELPQNPCHTYLLWNQRANGFKYSVKQEDGTYQDAVLGVPLTVMPFRVAFHIGGFHTGYQSGFFSNEFTNLEKELIHVRIHSKKNSDGIRPKPINFALGTFNEIQEKVINAKGKVRWLLYCITQKKNIICLKFHDAAVSELTYYLEKKIPFPHVVNIVSRNYTNDHGTFHLPVFVPDPNAKIEAGNWVKDLIQSDKEYIDTKRENDNKFIEKYAKESNYTPGQKQVESKSNDVVEDFDQIAKEVVTEIDEGVDDPKGTPRIPKDLPF